VADERILIVDDEPDILGLLVYHLSREGYRVSTAVDGPAAITAAIENPPDVLLLDLMLPTLDGYEVLQTLRSNPRTARTPVLLLTARGEEEERLRGFECGADDYVTKPFSPKEVVLRVRALLRRAGEEPVARSRRLVVGAVEIDLDAHRAFADGREMELTALEYELLRVLVARRGRVQSRTQLLQAVWETNARIETRTVDVHVARLRAKLGEAGHMIETVRGVGYRLSPEPR